MYFVSNNSSWVNSRIVLTNKLHALTSKSPQKRKQSKTIQPSAFSYQYSAIKICFPRFSWSEACFTNGGWYGHAGQKEKACMAAGEFTHRRTYKTTLLGLRPTAMFSSFFKGEGSEYLETLESLESSEYLVSRKGVSRFSFEIPRLLSALAENFNN